MPGPWRQPVVLPGLFSPACHAPPTCFEWVKTSTTSLQDCALATQRLATGTGSSASPHPSYMTSTHQMRSRPCSMCKDCDAWCRLQHCCNSRQSADFRCNDAGVRCPVQSGRSVVKNSDFTNGTAHGWHVSRTDCLRVTSICIFDEATQWHTVHCLLQ